MKTYKVIFKHAVAVEKYSGRDENILLVDEAVIEFPFGVAALIPVEMMGVK